MGSPTPTATRLATAPTPCSGDCNDDGRVTIDELVRGVNIALGNVDLGSCLYLDTNHNAQVSIAELIGAVRATLEGCTDAPIRVDGDPGDWTGIAPVWAEPANTTSLMVVSLWITNDEEFLYFLVELSFAPPEPGSYAFLDLDTDLNVGTGCGIVSNDVAIGAELFLTIPLTEGEYTYNALMRCDGAFIQLPVPIGARGRFAEMAVRIEDARSVSGQPSFSGFNVLVGNRYLTMLGHYLLQGGS